MYDLVCLTCRITVGSSNLFGILYGFDLMHLMKNGLAWGRTVRRKKSGRSKSKFERIELSPKRYDICTWFSVSMRAVNEFWNCAVTVSGCFRVFTVDWFDKFCPAVSVLTVCKFFNPFFGRSRGRNDLFFLFQLSGKMVFCSVSLNSSTTSSV